MNVRLVVTAGKVDTLAEQWLSQAWQPEPPVAEGVRDVIGRRLAQLSRDANQVLRVAAVVGPEFELAVLSTADNLAEDDLVSRS